MPAPASPHRNVPGPNAAVPPVTGPVATGGWPVLTRSALHIAFEQLVRRGLRGLWLRGELPSGPVVLAANHHSWWDAFVVLAVLSRYGRRGALLMDGANLGRYAFLRRIGVVSTRELRAAVAAIRAGDVLLVFPEGELRSSGPLGPLAPGAVWLAERAPATLVVAAVRIAVRGHQWPEAYVELRACHAETDAARTLATTLAGLDQRLGEADPERPPLDFREIVRGRRDWNERLSARPWRRPQR